MPTLSVKEVNKLMRADLKKEFPDTTFSIRANDFNSTRVSWTNGANFNRVKEICYRYIGSIYDSLSETRSDRVFLLNGVETYSAADYITLDREITHAVQLRVTREVLTAWGYGEPYISRWYTDDGKWVWLNRELPVYVQAEREISDRIRATDSSKGE